jgi:hypothetical protein
MRRVLLLAGVAAVVGTACAQEQLSGGGGEAPARAGAPAIEPATGAGGAGVVGAAALPALAPSVIKTADLEVEVRGFDDAMQQATSVAETYGGFVLSSAVQGEEGDRTGSVVLRVPSDRFGPAMTDLRRLGAIRGESIEGQEVGQEFVDLEARLRNLEAQETRILLLMRDADTIPETIRVQQVLEGIQLDIERIEGRLRYLEDQTTLATISLHLVEAGAMIAEPPGTIGRAWQEAVAGFKRVVGAVIVALGYLLPLALLAGGTLLVVRRVLRSPATNP